MRLHNRKPSLAQEDVLLVLPARGGGREFRTRICSQDIHAHAKHQIHAFLAQERDDDEADAYEQAHPTLQLLSCNCRTLS